MSENESIEDRPLKDGVVGGLIVEWFEENEDSDNLPIDAENYIRISDDEVSYRLTFEDGTVSDWKFTLEPDAIFDILAADKFNDVL